MELNSITLNKQGVALVQQWIDDPSSNRGFLLFPETEDGVKFLSSEADSSHLRPKLTVIYSPAKT
jgi:hypothetical protein